MHDVAEKVRLKLVQLSRSGNWMARSDSVRLNRALGDIHALAGDVDQALERYKAAMNLLVGSKLGSVESWLLFRLQMAVADVHVDLGNFEIARMFLASAGQSPTCETHWYHAADVCFGHQLGAVARQL